MTNPDTPREDSGDEIDDARKGVAFLRTAAANRRDAGSPMGAVIERYADAIEGLLRAVPGEEAGEEALILEVARRRYEQTRCSGMLACSACPAWDDLSDADRSAWANDWLAPHIRDAVASLRAPSSSEPVSAPSEDVLVIERAISDYESSVASLDSLDSPLLADERSRRVAQLAALRTIKRRLTVGVASPSGRLSE